MTIAAKVSSSMSRSAAQSFQLLTCFMRSECVALQVRLVNLVKKAVMPYKSHKGKVKSIAVIEPGDCPCTSNGSHHSAWDGVRPMHGMRHIL